MSGIQAVTKIKAPLWQILALHCYMRLGWRCADLLLWWFSAAFARMRRSDMYTDDKTGSSCNLDEGMRGSASGMLARMAVSKSGPSFGRSWSAVERPSPLSDSSGASSQCRCNFCQGYSDHPRRLAHCCKGRANFAVQDLLQYQRRSSGCQSLRKYESSSVFQRDCLRNIFCNIPCLGECCPCIERCVNKLCICRGNKQQRHAWKHFCSLSRVAPRSLADQPYSR